MGRVTLSVILPAKRKERWGGLYQSIEAACSFPWELIIITSEDIPEELKSKTNIRIIHSERSPLQKQQMGLFVADGEYITVMSDDALWFPDSIDRCLNILHGKDWKHFLVIKYYEGEEFSYPDWHKSVYPYDTNYRFMESDQYYLCRTHKSSDYEYIPENAPILSCFIMPSILLIRIGGWDCRFQGNAMANADLAARLIRLRCTYELTPVFQKCGHMPSDSGDHSALHYAQIEDDEPLLKKIYSHSSAKDRSVINLDNINNTNPIWQRRRK